MNKKDKTANQDSGKRVFFGNKDSLTQLDLIEIQKDSWNLFLNDGLKNILTEFFPLDDYTKKNFTLELVDIFFGEPQYDLPKCFRMKLTYQFPVYAKIKLTNKKRATEKVQDIYFFNLPKMTDRGTFVINGIERAVISQISRAPGVYFTADVDKTTGIMTYNAEIRPYIGAWLDFSITKNNIIEAKINKRRKFYVTSFIRSFKNISDNDLLQLFSQYLDQDLIAKYIVPTLEKDPAKTKDEAVLEIYKKIRPGEPLVLSTANEALENLFFNSRRYTLEAVGRYKINKKLGLDVAIDKENYTLSLQDIVASVSYLINLTIGKGSFDNIDHLANRRIRACGELVGMYGIRVGMVRAERDIKSRMSMTVPEEEVLPSQIVNSKAVAAAVNSFFKTSQLSTIVEQTNPLSELDNIRRITVAGPGGLAKERASFSIR
ncbi:MAG: DNA-directed RNA polymerase subunit beta, partial [Candidatus Roizmanbacteria bacterium]